MNPPPKATRTIRKGNRKPYRKGSNQEVAERIQEVITMLGNAYSRTDIIRAFRRLDLQARQEGRTDRERHKFDLDWRTIDSYIHRARAEMLKNQGKSREQARAEGVSFYESVLKSDADRRTKIIARERLDQIYGVDAPKRSQITGADGGPIQVQEVLSEEEITETSRTLLKELGVTLSSRFAFNGKTSGNGKHHKGNGS